jgi:hypothetical protein
MRRRSWGANAIARSEEGAVVTVQEAQRDMRIGLMGGFMGQLVSGVLWLVSAVLATWVGRSAAVTTLVIAGFFIFPLTKLGLRAIGHPSTVAKDNPLNLLGMQSAFVLPLCLPLVGAAALYTPGWFYPAFMILLGAHYLPFVTLYGMKLFYALAGVLLSAGLMLALYVKLPYAAGAWFTALVLIAFAFVGRWIVQREAARSEAGV